jgi:uncharacterized protein YacL
VAHVGFFETIARDLAGKGRVRLILQPTMAILLGIRVGLADARAGKPPFILRMLTLRNERFKLFKESIRAAIIPLCIALLLDSILQFITLRFVRPLAAVVVGVILVWIPFVVARALSNRAATRFKPRHA